MFIWFNECIDHQVTSALRAKQQQTLSEHKRLARIQARMKQLDQIQQDGKSLA